MKNVRRLLLVVGVILAAVVVFLAWFSESPGPSIQSSALPVAQSPVEPDSPAPHLPAPHSSDAGTGVVAGIVRWSGSGEPAPGVTVIATVASAGKPVRTKTADDGQWYLEGLSADVDYTFRVDNGGKPPFGVNELLVRVSADKVVEGQVLFVGEAGIIAGRVVRLIPPKLRLDAEKTSEAAMRALSDSMNAKPEKQPLPGVRLTLTQQDVAEASAARFTKTSDEYGNFRFDRIPVGRYELNPQTPEGAVELDPTEKARLRMLVTSSTGSPGVEIGFRFDSLTLTGRVVDRSSRPITGAAVRASMPGPYMFSVGVQEKTDDQGCYQLKGLPSANTMLVMQQASSHDGLSNGECSLIVHANGYASTRFVVPVVLDVQIAALGLEKRAGRGVSTTVAAGGVGNGIRATVSADGTNQTIHVPDIVMDGHATVSGHVRDTLGRTVENGELSAQLVDNSSVKELTPAATPPLPAPIGADGSFTLGGLAAGLYRFHVSQQKMQIDEDNMGEPFAVVFGQQITNIEIVVAAPEQRGAIRGKIVTADGKSSPRGFTAMVTGVTDGMDATPVRFGSLQIFQQEPGVFEITNISSGIAGLQVWVPSYPRYYQAVHITAGQTTNVSIRVAAGGSIEGMVTTRGLRAQNADVGLYVEDMARQIESAHEGGDGKYTLKDIAPGDYLVSAKIFSGHRRMATARVTVRSGETTRADLQLDGAAALSGRFLAPEEFKHRVVYVQFPGTEPVSPDNDAQIAARAIASDNANGGGDYAFEGLPDGQFLIVAVAYNAENPRGTVDMGALVSTATVTLRAGETSAANFDLH